MALKPHNHNESVPNTAYGSKYDTRYNTVTQLFDNEQDTLEVPDETVIDTFNAVLPSSEFSRIEPEKQLYQFIVPVSIDTRIEVPFKAQSVRIDNLTNQWLFLPNLRIFVPPDWFGTILTTNGMSELNVTFQAPSGLVNPAATPNTIVNVVAYFERLPNVAGTRRL